MEPVSCVLALPLHIVAEKDEAGGVSEVHTSACAHSWGFAGAGKSAGEGREGGVRVTCDSLCASAVGSETVCWDRGSMARPGFERGP